MIEIDPGGRMVRQSFLACLLAPLILLGLPSALPAQEGACRQEVARIVSLQGRAELKRAGQAQWRMASFEDPLCAQESLRVLDNSRVAIRLHNDTLLRLDQGTSINLPAIEEHQPLWLDLLQGVVHFISRTPRMLNIRTPFVNAAIEGTELLVHSGAQETGVWVYEGRVRVGNSKGELALGSDSFAIARAGQAPRQRLVARPRDAVQWALYYPPIIGSFAKTLDHRGEVLPFYLQGDYTGALARMPDVPMSLRDASYFNLLAGLQLAVGRVTEAQASLNRASGLAPDNGISLALSAIIAVTQGERDRALTLAEQAVENAPGSPLPQVALSYARQAVFDIEGALASAVRAAQLGTDDMLAWSRVAELRLSIGYLDKALVAAERSVALNPRLSRTQTVLGFAHLIRNEIQQARQAFEHAIRTDQADPLPRLGQGLAKIRRGELEQGRRDLEIAASLNPGDSLLRSYLGKAYFEEKRGTLAQSQFEMAKALDPKDPTPWFYDAIRKQSANRPVEALHDLQQSIELNDNRAVYRSRLLLDQDLAARSASLARIYNDLNFSLLALTEGWKSVNTDPDSFSAHRFLADSYAALPRHEIARVSELLQSQLLQPLNTNPIQSTLAESRLGILDASGPAALSFNEFNPLFTRDRLALQASGIAGNKDTLGNELTFSGLQGRYSFSLGQLYYQTDGFHDNDDLNQELYTAFGQVALSEKTSAQIEFRYSDRAGGERQMRLDPNDPFNEKRESIRSDTARLGLRHAFSPHTQVIGSLIYRSRNESAHENRGYYTLDSKTEDEGYLGEVQARHRAGRWNFIGGAGMFRDDRDSEDRFDFSPQPCLLGKPSCTNSGSEDIEQANAYLYTNLKYRPGLNFDLGLSVNSVKNEFGSNTQVNPKFGATWDISASTTLRAAAFQTLKRNLVADQTIEPTQIAGFNQFYDDFNSTDAWRYGIALDHGFSRNLFGGLEASRRDLKVPYLNVGGNGDGAATADWGETQARAYLYWTPADWASLGAAYHFERFEETEEFSLGTLDLKTHWIPISIDLFSPSGFSAGLTGTYVDQRGDFIDTVSDPATISRGSDRFWVFDASVNYRLSKGYGKLTLQVRNLFDEKFRYQETDPKNPRLAAGRSVVGRLILSF